MTTTTATAPATAVHELDLRVSDKKGLWAELVGHERPPVPDQDCLAVPPDAGDPCARRGCDRPAARYLAGHRRYARRDWRELVGLCVEDFGAHWAGETFLVTSERGDAAARRRREAAVSRRILFERWRSVMGPARDTEVFGELAGAVGLLVRIVAGQATTRELDGTNDPDHDVTPAELAAHDDALNDAIGAVIVDRLVAEGVAL